MPITSATLSGIRREGRDRGRGQRNGCEILLLLFLNMTINHIRVSTPRSRPLWSPTRPRRNTNTHRRNRQDRLTTLRHLTMPKKSFRECPTSPLQSLSLWSNPLNTPNSTTALTDTPSVDAVVRVTPETTPEDIMRRGVQVTQAFRNEIGKAVKTKRLTTGRTQKAFALEVGTTATTLRNIEMGLSLVSPPLLKRVVEATGLPFNPSKK